MTEEQKKTRKLSAESGNIRWIKDHCLRTKDGDEDYVFISYKSDDFEKVLDDIVFKTCKKYGLRVYFDTAFDENSDSWITQYYDNMCDPKCKAFIAFLNDAYYSSYACLLEMMTRKTAAAGGDYRVDSLFFLPINIGSINEVKDGSSTNTGLGTRRFSNGRINSHADEELEKFNEIFSEVADDFMRKSLYKRENHTQLYEEATKDSREYGKMYLNVTQCRRLMERVIPKKNDNDGENKSFADVIHDKLINAKIDSVFGKVEQPKEDYRKIPGESTRKNAAANVAAVQEKNVSKPKVYSKDGYSYTILGKAYQAGNREQGKLMYDAFSALIEKYPEKAEALTARTSVARAENVTNANTREAKPPYFRTCKKFTVGTGEYYVGTSYGFDTKIVEIKGMLAICGEDASEFELIEEPLKEKADLKKKADFKEKADNNDGSKENDSLDCFKYRLWNNTYTANKLANMMHDVFDMIAKKYPGKIHGIAYDDSITAVALKRDVDEGRLPSSKLNYFKASKVHEVDGVMYYVSTRYNREQGIGQLERMVSFCEGTSDSFRIVSAPDKSAHHRNEKTKEGITIKTLTESL